LITEITREYLSTKKVWQKSVRMMAINVNGIKNNKIKNGFLNLGKIS